MKATFFMLGQYNPCIKDAHDFNKANCTRYAPHFTLLCGASKGFMKALKTFIKPFEAPQRSLEIKI